MLEGKHLPPILTPLLEARRELVPTKTFAIHQWYNHSMTTLRIQGCSTHSIPGYSVHKNLTAKSKLVPFSNTCQTLSILREKLTQTFTNNAFSGRESAIVLLPYLLVTYKTHCHCSHLMRSHHLHTSILWKQYQNWNKVSCVCDTKCDIDTIHF